MDETIRLPFLDSNRKGYRLHKLEVFNWGTFDDKVYTARPNGNSTLLIGQNGSGKSTLVDAILTMLVRPGVRNFNVAAGAKKRERDERSYLLGAYDRAGDDGCDGVKVKFLRPKGDHYSVILAYFSNEDTAKSFTVAQLLYLASDRSVEKVYCLADGERSIRDDFGGLESSERLLKELRDRGLRVTKTFHDFENWFAKLTRFKPKAMEVFNQTVAVKDIQRLNDFVRDHMLERHDWNEKVDRLLNHFSQLNEAHESLVRVREQLKLLDPISRVGAEYHRQLALLQRAEQLQAAANSYFRHKTIDLFVPAIAEHDEKLQHTRTEMARISKIIEASQDEARGIKNEIDQQGGDRLRLIPALIKAERAYADTKRKARECLDSALEHLEIELSIADETSFAELRTRINDLGSALRTQLVGLNKDNEQKVIARAKIRHDLGGLRDELESLSRRRENIPHASARLRQALCAELGLAERDLPFAAELIEVRSEAGEWEPSIEKVLHGFALSLLVPDRFYQLVAKHVDTARLTVDGTGQRLVYLRIGLQAEAAYQQSPTAASLISKLNFRPNHPLVPWLKAELVNRFNYKCCETIEEFQGCRHLAMTRNRHIKSGNQRHEKDDRDKSIDPRNYVLGWDNREKKRRIALEVEKLGARECEFNRLIEASTQRTDELHLRLGLVSEVQRVTSFDDIDDARHVRTIQLLEGERLAIEEKSNAIRVLRKRLEAVESKAAALQGRYKDLVGDEREFQRAVRDFGQVVDNARAELRRLEADQRGAEHLACFAELDGEFLESPLNYEGLFDRERQYRADQESRVRGLREELEPVQRTLLTAMSNFLRVHASEAADLAPSCEYLDGFLGLRQRILDDDLPKHERRFKERLNQKVIEEIGLFRNSLERERREITDKIELLNTSLRKLEYRPGTHIQLEPRPIRDPEIAEFQDKLRECIEGSFEASAEANESRFVRIKELVMRLGDESLRRWREKVIDVRRWFDFVAAVIDRQTAKAVSEYQDSSGQSGGEKAKLAFTILVAAIAYQYDLDPEHPVSDRFHFVVVDEMFSKVDDQYSEYALDLFRQFGLQLLIVAPLDAKARVTQPYVGSYIHVVKKDNRSAIYEMSAQEFDETFAGVDDPQFTAADES